MAAVYAATHRNGNRVAIKMLHPEVAIIGDLRERFLKEGYVANQIGHDAAVRVLDDDETEDGGAFIVMDLLEGETLHARMARHGGSLPVEDVLCIIDRVLDALHAAHSKGILHRDVKPANVFITLGAVVKLLDFGIARVLEAAGAAHSPTMPGTVLGSPGFIPPEQARGRVDSIDARSDVWAVGATMFAAISGRSVHEADTVNEQIILAATRPAPSIRRFVTGLTPSVISVIDRALAFRKEDRFGSARDMQLAIQEAFHELQGHTISRGNQLAQVARELNDYLDSGDRDDRDDDETTVFPQRSRPWRSKPGGAPAPRAERQVTVERPSAETARLPGPVQTQLMQGAPGTEPSSHMAVVTPAPPTIPGFPVDGPGTGRETAPVSRAGADARKSGRAARWTSGRAVASAIAGAVLLGALFIGYSIGTRGTGTGAPGAPTSLLPSPSGASPTTRDPSEAPPPGATSTAEEQPTPFGSGSSTRTPSPGTSSRPTAPPSTAQADTSPATLNINSIPVTKVVLDGKPIGETPKIGLKVPPGSHNVTFVHPEKGRKTVTVTVAGGESRTVSQRF